MTPITVAMETRSNLWSDKGSPPLVAGCTQCPLGSYVTYGILCPIRPHVGRIQAKNGAADQMRSSFLLLPRPCRESFIVPRTPDMVD